MNCEENVINKKYSAAILKHLNKINNPTDQQEFYFLPMGRSKIRKRLRQLESDGLLKIETKKQPHVTYEITITKKGERVAELLESIDEIIYQRNQQDTQPSL